MRAGIATALAVCLAAPLPLQSETETAGIDRHRFDAWMEAASNWGRWGPDDELGTLNLITPEVRRAAAREVVDGVSVSLARTAETVAAVDNQWPFGHAMIGVGTPVTEGDGLTTGWGADRFEVSYHGFVHTHIDALCHLFHDGRMYNGYPQTLVSPEGAAKLSVLNMKDGILTRGVLIDVPRLLKVPFLDNDYTIAVEALDRWESESGVEIRAGDAVLFRTGRWAQRDAEGPWDPMKSSAGVRPEVALWLKERDVALVGSDTAIDALPSRVEGSAFPFHELAIVAMGMPILDSLDLETLSAEAAARKRNTFMLQLAPLAVAGATGSPVNPVATF